LTALDIFSKTT